jgi:hypothetical protein
MFRHQEWYMVEGEEIPERVLNRWRTEKRPPERVSAAEYLGVITALSPKQMDALGFQFRNVLLFRPFSWEEFWCAFDAEQLQSLLNGQVLVGTKEIAAAHHRLLALTPRIGPPSMVKSTSIRVRLGQVGNSVQGSVGPEGDTLHYEAQLPLKQPMLPPAVLRSLP